MSLLIRKFVGVLLIGIGIPIFILPIPFGFILIGIGLAMLWGHSFSSVMRLVHQRKSADPSFARFVDWVMSIFPVSFRRWFKQFDS